MRPNGADDGAVRAALDYIVAHQSEDGSWVDWSLPMGESDAWTTAYVGFRLGSLAPAFAKVVQAAKRAAAEWLERHVSDDGGWGYNVAAGTDADSTAYAILFLRGEGREVRGGSYDCLRSFQREDGGFSTYHPRNDSDSWGMSHPDVTPVAGLALLGGSGIDDIGVRRALRYVVEGRSPAGGWNSFWWETDLYSVEANIRFLGRSAPVWDDGSTRELLRKHSAGTPFEAALLLSCLLLSDPLPAGEAVDLAESLVRTQLDDGSWPSLPTLRVTKADCPEPWNSEDPGPLFSDQRRLFTTATALSGLCRIGPPGRRSSLLPAKGAMSAKRGP
jgi:squalene cyclase